MVIIIIVNGFSKNILKTLYILKRDKKRTALMLFFSVDELL
ncbi:hypothetical protein FORC60_1381 [Bacillus cereus]|jgi:hypothetical protein|nr:hypothetical protein FORC60_1381 [Bacillus cereus]